MRLSCQTTSIKQRYPGIALRRPMAAMMLSLVGMLAISPALSRELDAAELEELADKARELGETSAELRSCGVEPTSVALFSKAYADHYRSSQSAATARALISAYVSGARAASAKSITPDPAYCVQFAFRGGELAQLVGMQAAITKLDARLIPKVMSSTSKTLGGFLVEMTSKVPNTLQSCVDDASVRSELHAPYRDAMTEYLRDRNYPMPIRDDDIYNPFLRDDPPSYLTWHKRCPTLMYEAGMYAQIAIRMGKGGENAQERWLWKRIAGQ